MKSIFYFIISQIKKIKSNISTITTSLGTANDNILTLQGQMTTANTNISNLQPEELTACMSENLTIETANTDTQIPLATIRNQVGTNFSLQENEIKIGDNIHTVNLSGQIYWYQNVNGKMAGISVFKNNSLVTYLNLPVFNRNYVHTDFVTPIFAVQKDDIVKITVTINDTGAIINNSVTATFINIRKIN